MIEQIKRTSAVCVISLSLVSGSASAEQALVSSCESAECNTLPVVPEWNSAFANYKPFSNQPTKSWRELNDRVGEIGGWRTYAMEAYESGDSDTQSDNEPMQHSGGQHSGGQHSGGQHSGGDQ